MKLIAELCRDLICVVELKICCDLAVAKKVFSLTGKTSSFTTNSVISLSREEFQAAVESGGMID
jgi:hypothetical protein